MLSTDCFFFPQKEDWSAEQWQVVEQQYNPLNLLNWNLSQPRFNSCQNLHLARLLLVYFKENSRFFLYELSHVDFDFVILVYFSLL